MCSLYEVFLKNHFLKIENAFCLLCLGSYFLNTSVPRAFNLPGAGGGAPDILSLTAQVLLS